MRRWNNFQHGSVSSAGPVSFRLDVYQSPIIATRSGFPLHLAQGSLYLFRWPTFPATFLVFLVLTSPFVYLTPGRSMALSLAWRLPWNMRLGAVGIP